MDVGHAKKGGARSEQRVESGEFVGGVIKVFDDFAAKDEVPGLFERAAVRVKKGVIEVGSVVLFAEHGGYDRAGAGAEVEALASGRQVVCYGGNERGDEGAVSGVVGVVLVAFVAGFFRVGGKELSGITEDAFAGGAAVILIRIIRG
jgi:hypothetical protein